MKSLDMSIRAYDNIIIAAHALDVLIFFYDFITSRSLVVLCSKPKSKLDFDSLNSLIVNKGTELIILDDLDTYSPLYVLSDRTKFFINSISEYKSDRIITQVRATTDSDKIARDIYDYCVKLNIKNHYTIKLDKNNKDNNNKNNKKEIPRLFLDIANNFTKNNMDRVNYLSNIYSYVNGLEKI
jgi:hypothetical protein